MGIAGKYRGCRRVSHACLLMRFRKGYSLSEKAISCPLAVHMYCSCNLFYVPVFRRLVKSKKMRIQSAQLKPSRGILTGGGDL